MEGRVFKKHNLYIPSKYFYECADELDEHLWMLNQGNMSVEVLDNLQKLVSLRGGTVPMADIAKLYEKQFGTFPSHLKGSLGRRVSTVRLTS